MNKGNIEIRKIEIEQEILNKINMVEGEKITKNIDIVHEFLLDQGYNWIRRNINYYHSSLELADDIKYIIGVEISHLDFKYCMELLGIQSDSISIKESEGLLYYPISEPWYIKMKQWSNERKDKKFYEEKYERMKAELAKA